MAGPCAPERPEAAAALGPACRSSVARVLQADPRPDFVVQCQFGERDPERVIAIRDRRGKPKLRAVGEVWFPECNRKRKAHFNALPSSPMDPVDRAQAGEDVGDELIQPRAGLLHTS